MHAHIDYTHVNYMRTPSRTPPGLQPATGQEITIEILFASLSAGWQIAIALTNCRQTGSRPDM